MIEGLGDLNLSGTSADKLAALMQHVRDQPKASAALWIAERAPHIGETVKFLLYEAPDMDPSVLDGAIDALAAQLLALRSDAPSDAEPDAQPVALLTVPPTTNDTDTEGDTAT